MRHYLWISLTILLCVMSGVRSKCHLQYDKREAKGYFFLKNVLEILEDNRYESGCWKACMDHKDCKSVEISKGYAFCKLYSKEPESDETFFSKKRMLYTCEPDKPTTPMWSMEWNW